MRNGPALWDRLLGVIRPVFGPDAVIAGGAVRDYHLGLPIKDLDVFVNPFYIPETNTPIGDFPSKHTDDGAHFGIAALNNRAVDDTFSLQQRNLDGKQSHELYEEWSQGAIRLLADGLWTFYYEGRMNIWDVNIIGRVELSDGMPALVNTFDMGIVRAAYNGQEYYTQDFYTDFNNRTATALRKEGAGRSHERYVRFNRRHPGVLREVNRWL